MSENKISLMERLSERANKRAPEEFHRILTCVRISDMTTIVAATADRPTDRPAFAAVALVMLVARSLARSLDRSMMMMVRDAEESQSSGFPRRAVVFPSIGRILFVQRELIRTGYVARYG